MLYLETISKQECNMEIQAPNIDQTMSATAYRNFELTDLRDIIQAYCVVEQGLQSNFDQQYFTALPLTDRF